MDEQKFAEALEKFKNLTEQVKTEQYTHFVSSIENFMKACEINLDLIEELKRNEDLYQPTT